jgi:hypothetical protein
MIRGIAGRSVLITRRWVMARAASGDIVVLGSRNGTVSIVAALEVGTGQVIVEPIGRNWLVR